MMSSRRLNGFPRLLRVPALRSFSSSPPPPPPMLLKIRKDLKTAMQNQDKQRLLVLRSVLSATLNASKTANPIKTDVQMLSLLKKTINSSQTAHDEFTSQGRPDLAEKEAAQITILEEYASGISTLPSDELTTIIKVEVHKIAKEKQHDKIHELKAKSVNGQVENEGLNAEALEAAAGTKIKFGDALKRVMGVLEGKNVEKGEVVQILKKTIAEVEKSGVSPTASTEVREGKIDSGKGES